LARIVADAVVVVSSATVVVVLVVVVASEVEVVAVVNIQRPYCVVFLHHRCVRVD